MKLREQIIKARKKQGYTQISLASEIGVRQATISEFESGKRSLRFDILEKLLQTLEINIMDKLEEKELQIELSSKIAHELINKGIEDIEPLTLETIHMMTRENCGDYILSLKILSEEEYLEAEKNDTAYKTWNLFKSVLKFDFVYLLSKP